MLQILKDIFEMLTEFFNGPFPDLNSHLKEQTTGDPDLKPAVDIIKKWEGFRSKAYQDSVGVWTIGYGTTFYSTGKRVSRGDTITREQAETELMYYVENKAAKPIKRLVKVPLNNNQFCALVSFIYNVGSGAFTRSTMLKRINSKNYDGAAAEFDRWVHAGGRKLLGLVRRRNEEQALFLQPSEHRVV